MNKQAMSRGGEDKLSTLIDMAMEYVAPYMELRRDPELLRVGPESL